MVFLLLRRGALSNGGGSVPYAKYTPLQEAMMYARCVPYSNRTACAVYTAVAGMFAESYQGQLYDARRRVGHACSEAAA